ncbi:hypothetical protein [Lysobacter gummosus]|uniref:hypothetical protein n=1 Tax=Lysobacter gummosus TaxID=262324 RepID=UPI00363488CA
MRAPRAAHAARSARASATVAADERSLRARVGATAKAGDDADARARRCVRARRQAFADTANDADADPSRAFAAAVERPRGAKKFAHFRAFGLVRREIRHPRGEEFFFRYRSPRTPSKRSRTRARIDEKTKTKNDDALKPAPRLGFSDVVANASRMRRCARAFAVAARVGADGDVGACGP